MKHPVVFIVPLLLQLLCQFDGNKYNPDDPAYISPWFAIDTTASNVLGGDTVLADSLRMVLIGNDEQHRNMFRWSLDGSAWSAWEGDGKEEYVIRHTAISGGTHTVTIEYCYHPEWNDTRDSTITFFRAIKPSIAAMVDTLFDVDAGIPCTLWVKAEGTGELSCEWYRDNDKIGAATDDSLFLDTVSVDDTVHDWFCRISNTWGAANSPNIRLRILLRVFYNSNGATGGEVPADTNRYVTDAIVEVPGNPGNLIRRGYTFSEWNTKSDGSGNARDSGDIFKIGTESVTLYARWHPNDSFTVAYDGNGAEKGELPASERYYKVGELVAVAGNSGKLERSGYTFTGWNTRADDSGTGYVENDTFEMGETHVTLFARWTDKPTFKVTYFANGADSGGAPEDANEYEEGDTVIVASNSGDLRKEGNTFVGWSTEAEGNDAVFYTPGETFLMKQEYVKLYARWTTKPTYTLTYLGNGNTSGSPPAAIENEAGAEVNIAGQGSLIRKGYSFIAWDTKADTSGDEYRENAPYTMMENNDTLYAQWEINLYTLTYDGNCSGAENVPKSTTREYDMAFFLSSDKPTCIGHTFNTWKTEKGVDYDPGASFRMPDANVILHADWTVNNFTITYNGNTNTGGNVPDSVMTGYGDSVTITGKGSLEKTGHSFAGWNTKNDGNGTPYPVDTVILMGAGDMALYAKWTVNQYKVVFDSHGGSVIDSQMVKYNDTVKTPAAPTKTGFAFDGWYREAACTTAWTFATDKVTEDVALYAGWTKDIYKVKFVANIDGADGEMADQAIAYDSTAHLTPNGFRKDGWIFAGWAENPEGAVVVYANGAEYTMGLGGVTLYGVWSRDTYAVTYEANDATGGTPPGAQSKTYGIPLTLATNTGSLVRTGHRFAGWNTAANGGGTSYDAGGSYTANAAVTLYAKWTVDTYAVTYDANDATGGTPPGAQSKTYGVPLTLATNTGTLVRTGYSFAGWNTAANGGGTDYAEGTEYTANAAVVLYAKWKNPAGMAKIAAMGKTFSMGDANTMPIHQVTFTRDFWLDTTEVTQGQYRNLMAATYSGYTSPSWSSSYGIGDNYPAYYVNWYDAVLYCNARTKATGSTDTVYSYTSITGAPGNDCVLNGLSINLTRGGFRLPTEAQWEYACRGGTTSDFYWGIDYDPYPSTVADSNEVDEHAVWYRNSYHKGSGSADYGTHPVATKTKNSYGLYDMSGNVLEWCNDWWGSYSSEAQTDPVGPATGLSRVLRGGGWYDNAFNLRSVSRLNGNPDGTFNNGSGFRVCLPAQ